VPFAVFFSYLQGDGLRGLGSYYIASAVFSLLVSFAVEANRKWVAPRLEPATGALPGPPRSLQVASYGVAAILGSVAAGMLLHYTIAPGTFGSGRAIVLLLLFSALFTAMFLGVIYATRMKNLYVQRIRDEAEAKVREEEEMRVAAGIQQALLPPRSRAGATYDAAGASIPCRSIGGDFFEYFDLPGGRTGFALGDVAGKGPPAAILAAKVQGIFATSADGRDGPAATLTRVNEALCHRAVESRFATIAYVMLAPDGTLLSSSAGHNPAFLLGLDGAVRRLHKGGLVVGAFENATYEEETVGLRAGDTLVLFSDGVSDAEDPTGEQFGEERLQSILADRAWELEPEEILERVLDATRVFAAGHPPADDITVLVVRYRGEA